MTFKVGDKIIYDANVTGEKCVTGEIIAIWKNKRDIITSYFAVLDSGFIVQFRPHNMRWSKLEEFLLVV